MTTLVRVWAVDETDAERRAEAFGEPLAAPVLDERTLSSDSLLPFDVEIEPYADDVPAGIVWAALCIAGTAILLGVDVYGRIVDTVRRFAS